MGNGDLMSDDTDTSVTRTADRSALEHSRPRLGKRKKRRPLESDGGIVDILDRFDKGFRSVKFTVRILILSIQKVSAKRISELGGHNEQALIFFYKTLDPKPLIQSPICCRKTQIF